MMFGKDKEERKEMTGFIPADPELSRWMHDNEKEIQWDLMARLKGGYVIKNDKDELEIKYPDDRPPEPLMNNKGVDATMVVVSSFLSRIHGLSVYDEDRIMQICHETSSAITRLYAVNMMEFNLTPSKARMVKVMIMDYFESNIRKSMAGLALRLASQMQKTIETVSGQKSEKKRLGLI